MYLLSLLQNTFLYFGELCKYGFNSSGKVRHQTTNASFGHKYFLASRKSGNGLFLDVDMYSKPQN